MIEKTNLTQEQVIEAIRRVAQNHRRKTFDVHEEDDIEQQVYQIALIALPKYHVSKSKNKDPLKAFESWLNALVSKRLVNFYRDEYGVKHKPRKHDTEFETQKRVNLSHPVHIDNLDIPDPLGNSSDNEFFNFLLKEMDYLFVEVMFACMSGENVGSYYRYRLQNKILEVRKKWQLKEKD